MQWLINIVTDALGIPPVYIDRGQEAPSWDFTKGDLTADGAFHDLDISSIVPTNASAVLFHIALTANDVNGFLTIRAKGITRVSQRARIAAQIANHHIMTDGIIGPLTDGLIQYSMAAVAYTVANIRVKGWWL